MTSLNENDEHCHQRPESEWREEFDRKYVFSDFLCCNGDYCVAKCAETTGDEIKTFIARQRDSEYQRGLAEGDLQNTRLLENNKLLTERIRELEAEKNV